MSSEEVSEEFKQMLDKTKHLVQNGQFREILKLFEHHGVGGGGSSPEYVAALKMVANGMKAKGDHGGALSVYTKIYNSMSEDGGTDQPATLEALADVISVTRDVKTAYDLTAKGLRISNEIKDKKSIENFTSLRESVFANMTSTQKSIYKRLEERKRKAKKISDANEGKHAGEDVHDIDELIAKFGLEEYDTKK
jgi:hypothetical protein